MVDFPDKLKQLRNSEGLTQEKLAQRLNITKSMISAYETGMRLPSLDIIIKLSNTFGVSSDYLLGIDKRHMIDITNLSERQIDLIMALIDEFTAKNKP